MVRAQEMEKVILPGPEFDVEAGRGHFVSVSFVGAGRKNVVQLPTGSAEIETAEVYLGLRSELAEIDNYQVTLMQIVPCPSDQVLEAGIVHPTGPVAQGPFALTK